MRDVRAIRLLLVAVSCAAVATVSACSSTAAAQPSPAAAAHVSQQDRAWIDKAHQANMAESDAGQLAVLDGASAAVRSTGAVMNRDHEALDAALIKVTGALRISLPTSQTVEQTDAYDRLTQETGRQFDYDFIGTMLAAHQGMINATRTEISHGSSARVIKLARQALPVLLKHLKMLQAAASAG